MTVKGQAKGDLPLNGYGFTKQSKRLSGGTLLVRNALQHLRFRGYL